MPASLPMQLTSVKTLNGTNYEDWKESLVVSSCVKLLNETKQVLNTHFDMKDLGDAFFFPRHPDSS